MLNLALWKKAFRDAWKQLLASCGILVAFSWIFVWLMSHFQPGAWSTMLDLLPDFMQPMLGVPLARLASVEGQLSVLFVHVVTMIVCIGWAVGRGSDMVSGEISRGSMEHLLVLPVWRWSLLVPPAVVATIGAFVLAGALWLGLLLSLATIELTESPSPMVFLPGVANLITLTICMTGITTAISACGHDRWRAIWWSLGVFIVSQIVEMISRLWPDGAWLKYTTLMAAFQPQKLILIPEQTNVLLMQYSAALVTVGLVAYAVAALVLTLRDIPLSR
jgi:ABC-2 type transport system permease protein